MPRKLSTPCRRPGCKELVAKSGYCKEHAPQTAPFYKTAQWKRLRLIQLSAEPLCEDCKDEGRIVPASVADHVIPINQGGPMYDINNLRSLCARHHNIKRAHESKQAGGGR